MWSVVIVDVDHKQQILPSAPIERLDVHIIDVRDVEFFVAIFMRRDLHRWSKRSSRTLSNENENEIIIYNNYESHVGCCLSALSGMPSRT
jgi:Ulp1 family protease